MSMAATASMPRRSAASTKGCARYVCAVMSNITRMRMPSSDLRSLYQPLPDRVYGCLHPRRHSELGKDLSEVLLHGLLADPQRDADLLVRLALYHQAQHS